MHPVKILAVAPYHGLSELIAQVAAKRADVSVTTLVGDLDAGLHAAREALRTEVYDMILSRGGTADLLSREMDIPTLDASISLGDILQAIKLAQNYRAPFAIVGFPSITERARLICNLLNYTIPVHTIHEADDVPGLLASLRDSDCRMCLGDVVTTTVARKQGLNAILITSSAESIETALDQAVKLRGSYFKLRDRNRLLRRVIDQSPTRVMVYGADAAPRLSTLADGDESIARFVAEALPALRENAQGCIERVVGDRVVTLEARRDDEERLLIVYARQRPVPPALSDGGVTILNRTDTMHARYNRYYGFSGVMEDTNRAIERFGRGQTPIVLLGEQGTGKDSVAAYLYSIGPYAANPLYAVDLAAVSDKQLVWLLRSPESPLNQTQVTLYFKNIMQLPSARREQLLQFLEHLRFCRVICAFLTREDDRDETAAAHAAVCARLGAVSLRLPPLRERRADIPSIATLYLSQLNANLGKQLTGFEPEALRALTEFDWPYNLDQFQRILRELASMTQSFYISAQDAAMLLAGERAGGAPTDQTNIDLRQTLDEITYDVVKQVLAQEGNNQKKTAQRLAIGRSTVWRILKSHEGGADAKA